ncbi:superoxide dismutase [Fe] [Myroides sp. BIT-d1]|uniref:Superoxide dismutase n=1 Tax=Myroides albus TaxID=2562892 RepID=A0A6I3LM69_9FLAO|nr:superoxide dismutase [Myroides albus]MTG97262.1 superoxide dismutase [Fe] [Myroides albus]
MTFTLPQLPYETTAFEPIISKEGFEYHYGKHHQTYVNNLNNLITNTQYENESLENIIKVSFDKGETGIYNNAAQHFNHSFYWKCLTPQKTEQPHGKIKKLIERDFNSIEEFKKQFTEIATKLFGAGWVWLALNMNGQLEILPMKDADTPLIKNMKPILTIDVWEHAYYIDHRNARPKFIEGFWEIINWEFANQNLL